MTMAVAASAGGALTAAEQARLARQIAGLRHIDAQDRAQARSEWDKGAFCRRVRDSGLWRRSAEHRAASFVEFVAQVTSLRSRSTVERRLLLVEHYGREEYLSYLGAGTCATALVEIARAEEGLRPALLELARTGLTVAEVGLLRGAGRSLLRARAPEREALGERLRTVLALERLRPRERRRNGPRAASGAGPAAAPAGAGTGQPRLAQAGGGEALQAGRQALQAERAQLAAAQAALRAAEEALAGRERALAEEAARQEEAAQQMARLQQELAAERADLEFHRERVQADQERLQAERQQLLQERFAALRWLRQGERIEWPLPPLSLDETLLQLEAHLEQVLSLAELGRQQCDRERQHPAFGGFALIYQLKGSLRRASEALRPLIRDLALDYRARHPADVERFLREVAEAERGGPPLPEAARPQGPARPPREFHLPTAAILGTGQAQSPQHAVLGFTTDRQQVVTLDLNGVQTVGIFGQQGAGKSHTILGLTEAALASLPGVSRTPAPLAVIHCHYHPDADSYAPPFARYLQPNDEQEAVAVLRGDLAARPRGLGRCLVLVPPMEAEELAARRAQHAGAEVVPLKLSARELGMEGLKLLMGAGKGAPLYMMKIQHALSALRDPSPAQFREAIDRVKLPGPVREIVEERLRLIDRIVGEAPLSARIGPGDFVGLDMRAPWMDESMAMALFTVSMNAFAQARHRVHDEQGGAREVSFRKMMVFDEAHKYMGRGTLSADILKMVREMRHRDMWVVYASQDPESVHPALIKLSSVLLVHQLKAKSSVKVLRDNFAGCEGLEVGELARMGRGEARVVAVDCADPAWRSQPQPVLIRPTCARPGGTTRPAVGGGG